MVDGVRGQQSLWLQRRKTEAAILVICWRQGNDGATGATAEGGTNEVPITRGKGRELFISNRKRVVNRAGRVRPSAWEKNRNQSLFLRHRWSCSPSV